MSSAREWGSAEFVNSQTTVRKYLLPRVDRGRGPTQSIWRSDHGKVIPLQWCSVVLICRLELATHQASFNVFRYVLLHARPVCYLLERFIGGLDTVVSCAWCIMCVCQHHPPLAARYYELWRSEWLRDICENTVSKMQHVLDRVERAEFRSEADLWSSRPQVLLRCAACPFNSFGWPQARFQVRICSFGPILPQCPVLGVSLAR